MKKHNILFVKTFLVNLYVFFIIYPSLSLGNENNSIVALVDNTPITSIDIREKSKLIHFNEKNNNNYLNLQKYFQKSLKILVEEALVVNEAKKYNKDIIVLTKKDATKYVLQNFSNSKNKFESFLNSYDLSKDTFLMKYQINMIKKYLIDNQFSNELNLYSKQIDVDVNRILKNQSFDQINFDEIRIKKISDKENLSKILKLIFIDIRKGFNFKQIVKVYSKEIPISGKKISWKKQNQMPLKLFNKIFKIQEGKIIKIDTKDHIKLIKLLAKRIKGKVSKRESKFEVLKIIYDTKIITQKQLNKKIFNLKVIKNCNDIMEKINKKFEIRSEKLIVRLADLNEYLINQMNLIQFNEMTKPIFQKNYAMTFFKCKKIKSKPLKSKKDELIQSLLNKKFEILNLKLIRRLKKEAIIDIK